MVKLAQPTGHQVKRFHAPVNFSQDCSKRIPAFIIYSVQFQYHVYPESSQSVVEEVVPLLFMFMSDTEAGALKGYGVKNKDKELVARELWTVNLMKDSQTITNVVAKRQNGKCNT